MIEKTLVLLAVACTLSTAQQAPTSEVFLGTMFPLSHGVGGSVYAIDDQTIRVRNLNYDGQAPDAYFWVGSTARPDANGTPLADEKGSTSPLKGYRNANVVLHLPAGITVRQIKHFGIWCKKFKENMGYASVSVN
ncbi:hypothetical protein TYRP_014277 [Tyrophagus putrescentiae]|nr:hypothetical protein TYRP_014277 [Tyrophagus putrescentiae]